MLRPVLAGHVAELRRALDLAPQTNEVGRSACLAMGLFEAVRRHGLRRVRLLEPGASAGLNLNVDRYRIIGPGWSWGPADSPLILDTKAQGARPETVTVIERRGCDLSPVDVSTRHGALYLTSFVWPFNLERHARLAAAIDVARRHRVTVDRAPASTWISEQLARPVADDVLTSVEIGPELASVARRNLSAFPNVEVVDGAFESWQPPDSVRFDLVFAATTWHWIDPAVRYRRAWELLRPGGHLAFWSATHVLPEGGDPFFAEIQDVYDEIGEALPAGASRPRPGTLPDDRAEIEHSGLFRDVVTRHVGWEVSYTADEYLLLLDTFSGHIAMHPWQRARLYSEIRRRLAQRPNGRLRRGWGAVLHVARRVDPESKAGGLHSLA